MRLRRRVDAVPLRAQPLPVPSRSNRLDGRPLEAAVGRESFELAADELFLALEMDFQLRLS
jgi:hypothetical protein